MGKQKEAMSGKLGSKIDVRDLKVFPAENLSENALYWSRGNFSFRKVGNPETSPHPRLSRLCPRRGRGQDRTGPGRAAVTSPRPVTSPKAWTKSLLLVTSYIILSYLHI